MFSDSEEDAIAVCIITEILMKGILFIDEDFEDRIVAAFNEKYRDEEDIAKISCFSLKKFFEHIYYKNCLLFRFSERLFIFQNLVLLAIDNHLNLRIIKNYLFRHIHSRL